MITIKGYNPSIDIKTYKPRSELLSIPRTLNGVPVVSIGDNAFYSHHDLVSLTIPDGVTSIGSGAFQSCGLTNIVIPESITNIGFGAFAGCPLTSISIPKSVSSIGQVAFGNCSALNSIVVDPLNPAYRSIDGVLLNKAGTILIKCPSGKGGIYRVPDGVVTIGDSAFTTSGRLSGIVIPDTVTGIEWHAFMSCIALTNVAIGSGVTNIGADSAWLPFNDCLKLEAITVAERNRAFASSDGVLFDKGLGTLLKFPQGKSGAYIVPNNVTKIAAHAFTGGARVTGVQISENVKNIEDHAFEYCAGLKSVTIGNNVTNIGSSAFGSCTNLTSVMIPDSVHSIGDAAFYGCLGLTNVGLGKNVDRIGEAAFGSCSGALTLTVDPLNASYGSKDGILFPKGQKALDMPKVSIQEPANGTMINAIWVDVRGTITAPKQLKKIIVESESSKMATPGLINGNTFEARNVFLGPGTNMISAIAEDMEGNASSNAIVVIGPTETNISRRSPIEVQVTPSAGFAPLTVTLNVRAQVPGKIQKVFYDFDGNNVADQIKTDLQPVTHTYRTAGEYFPVVTVQTTIGHFSSLSGLAGMFALLIGGSEPVFVNVESPPVLLSTIKIADPVDIKWTSNLYILSGSTATISEFDSKGKFIRSKAAIGSNASGLDVDAAGNVYVAITGNNQVRRFKPNANSFEPDPSFGTAGFIGNEDGSAGSNSNQFNAPFDVAISRDGQTITVADSGNQRLQRFTINGTFMAPSLDEADLQDQFKAPKGLATDEIGLYLFVAESGGDRIALTETVLGFRLRGISGTNGAALGQFKGATHLSANRRALYVADTGNNRVQVFHHVESGHMHSPTPFTPRLALSAELGLSHPKSVAAVDDRLEEKLYIADTGNNRVILVKLPSDNPEAVWKHFTARLEAGDIEGAISDLSMTSKDSYRETFHRLPKAELRSGLEDMKDIKPAFVERDHAQYYFETRVQGTTLTFPIEFSKEFGLWKVVRY